MGVKRGIVGYRRSLISTPTYMDGLLVNNYWDSARCPVAPWSITNSNLTAARISGSGWVSGFAKSIQPLDRPSVFEFRLDGIVGGSIPGFSIADPITAYLGNFPGGVLNTAGISWVPTAGGAVYKGAGISSPIGAIPIAEAEFVPGDVIGYGYNPTLGTMKIWRNGIALYAGAPVFTGLAGKKVTPMGAFYNIGDKMTMQSGKSLKYKYSDYSLSNEGLVEPMKALRFLDVYRKPTVGVISDNGYSIYAPTNPASTGYVSTPFDVNKKSVIEFIAHSITVATYVGFMFDDANKSGPRAGVLGQLTKSAAFFIGGSSRGTFSANGCTLNITTLSGGTSGVVVGDVFAFGYDPVARTIVGWKNGVAINSGNPIWSNLPVAEVSAAYSLNQAGARVRLNPDALRYNYGDYTE